VLLDRAVGGELAVARHAQVVARGRRELAQLRRRIDGVRIVARRTRHLRRASAELVIATLAGADRAAARVLAALATFPRPRVVAEQHRVALRAGVVDPLRARAGLPARRRDPDDRALHLERRQPGRLGGVLLRAVVAGLAADAELDEVRAVEQLL